MHIQNLLKPFILIGFFVFCALLSAPTADAATYTVTSTANAGAGTLRQAILDANSNVGADTIEFNIAGAGPHTITPTAYLPDITDQVTIDGLSQPNATCGTLVPATLPAANNTPHNLLIELDASDIPGPTVEETGALRLVNSAASGSIIRGMVINRIDNITFDGIMLRADAGETLSDVLIECNYIGTDTSGTSAPGGLQFSNGILVYNNGGTVVDTTISNNLISGLVFGIQGFGSMIVEDNLFGVNATATGVIGQLGSSVIIGSYGTYSGTASVRHNIVGGGQDGGGVGISQNGVESMTIEDNYVGVDITGTVALPNEVGISGPGFASTTVTNNIVSGNKLDGIAMYASSGVTEVFNNRIGLDVNNDPLGNGRFGIGIEAFSDSGMDIHDNTIANNADSGIAATQSASVPSLSISDNTITNNQNHGIHMENSDVEISSNTIASNLSNGIYITTTATGITLEQNTIDNSGNDGVYINSGSHTITDNTVTNSGSNGMSINGNNNQISGNQVSDSIGVGMALGGSDDIIQNNQATNNFTGFDVASFGATLSNNVADSNAIGFNVAGGNNTLNSNQTINNTSHGVQLAGASNMLTQNYIGVTDSGVIASNQGSGIFIIGANSATIGGDDAAERNYVSANGESGINVFACGSNITEEVVVTGNYIGTNLSGEIEAGYGNGGSGVQINEQELIGCGGGGGGGDSSIYKNRFGGDNPGEQNVIAGNAEDGIRIYQAPNMDVFSNSILPNSIFGNDNLGINLAADSDNDGVADTDLGPNPLNNNLMSYPAINANYYINRPTINFAYFSGNQLTVNYDFQANQADNSSLQQSDVVGYRLDFYINDAEQDGAYAGYNQGKTHLGSFIVNGSEAGASHVFTSSTPLSTSKSISATATVLWRVYECPNAEDKSGNGPPYGNCGGGGE